VAGFGISGVEHLGVAAGRSIAIMTTAEPECARCHV
jgi:hypothetical protein